MNRVLALLGIGGAIIAPPAAAQAQAMSGMMMPGKTMPGKTMPMPAKSAAAKKSPPRAVVRKAVSARHPVRRVAPSSAPAAMPGITMSGTVSPAEAEKTPAMTMAGVRADHDMAMPGMAADDMAIRCTTLPAGNAPPPPLPTDHYADRQFDPSAMAAARMQMMRENGAQQLSKVMFNLAEYQVHAGKDGYRWDGEGWFGGDIDRAVIKTEGSGTIRDGVDAAEIQALYSHAIGPYFDLQAGIRHDLAPSPTRTYATIGVEGLAPYMFNTEAAVFLSNKGEVLGRLEGWYDQRLTQRLVLQPRVELNLSAQDIPETRVGAGLSDAELGLRLRYEIAREFAPYVGVSYEAKTGRSADYARADGKDTKSTSLVAGVRFWF